MKSQLEFYVNGQKVVEKDPDPEWTLLFYLREKLSLCGTKLGCGEGGCGACTVMVSMYEKETKTIKHMSVNACLAPVCAMHGLAVTTVEGIGSTKTKLHAIQERMSKMHASQCGFCTPGIVMSMYTLLRNKPIPCMADVEEYFKGNLCRCTGYRPILEAMKTFCIPDTETRPDRNGQSEGGENSMVNDMTEFTSGFTDNNKDANSEVSNSSQKQSTNAGIDHIKEAQLAAIENSKVQMNESPDMDDNRNISCGAGENCCKRSTAPDKCTGIKLKESIKLPDATSLKFIPYDPSQEPIYPPSLLLSNGIKSESLVFQGERVTWYRPTTLNELLSLKEQFPYAKIVVGNTEVGLETKFKHLEYPVLIHPSHIKELKEISILENGVTFGASVTLDEMETVCRRMIEKLPAYKTRVLSAFVEMMQWFAGKQIRYVAAVGGNIMTGSPISDLIPIFMASKCRLDVACKNEKRSLEMNEKFYVGYRKTCLKPEEVLVSITLPFTETNEYFQAYKQAKRRDDDIAIVNAAFRMVVEGALVKDATFCYGGLAPTSKLALKTMELLRGKQLGDGILEATLRSICSEFNLPPNAPGGMVRYRRSLAMSLFFKFFLHVAEEINVSTSGLLKHCSSATEKFHKGVINSHQFFKLSDGEKKVVGKPIPHKSGDLHTTGEAVYVDDMAKTKGELELVFVTSTKPHAKILDIDPSKALLIDGVVDFVSHKDLPPERNLTGIPDFSNDEELFASNVVHCVGQVIGAVVATDKNIARRAANKVKVSYEELPAIVTIEQAIAANSYYGDLIELKRGNVQEGFDKCDHIIEGTMRTGAQEHFYLETQACIAFPLNENDEIIIYSSTQSPSDTQKVVAKALGLDHNRIVCKTKRLGGGFGGKETKAPIIAAAVAVVACKIGKPVRIMLDRNEDMIMTGGRHPFLAKYKVGFNNDGRIVAANTDLYSNAGWSIDLSLAVLEQAIFQCDNSYFAPYWRSSGRCCKTNLASNTAFRGFGAKQGMMMAETWINDIATFWRETRQKSERRTCTKVES
ncbi:xanthine dehydrogenase-like isoform X1 [Rhopilema esculentum]|uniref:xanthine dehydrogenase-like isoform X1 n=1 Tax=Rhopilema esculentum TaxID=499914 RepID=UPI0031E3484D